MHCAEFNCAEFKVRLDAVLDARRPPQRDADLSAHARECPQCARWMAAHATLLGAVQTLPPIVARADFSTRVVQQFEVDKRSAVRRRRLAIASLAVAAGLLIALLPWQNWWSAPDRAKGPIGTAPHSIAQHDRYAWLMQGGLALAGSLASERMSLVDEVADGFKPVTSSVYTALHSLWRTLPGNEVARTLLL